MIDIGIWSLCLLGLLFFSYGIIRKHFFAHNSDSQQEYITAETVDNTTTSKFSLKKALVLLGILWGCYIFVSLLTMSVETPDYRSQQRNSTSGEQKYYKKTENKKQQIDIITADQIKTSFTEVAGLHEAKDEVQDIIRFLQNPKKFNRLGAKSPKGILLYGPPGNGKTLLARAIAGEAKVNFIATSGSQFDEEYVGVGAARIRELFSVARKNAPCIVFIDEIDSLGFKRNNKQAYWAAQTVNQLLSEMDGLDEEKNQGVILLAASNRIDVLDPAILRPGRFDRHIKIDYPTIGEREDLLKIFLKRIKINKHVTSNKIAKITPGFSAAELANLVNEAAIYATKQDKPHVDLSSFDSAKDRVILGSKRQALKMTEKERRITAYHEAGHALVGILLSDKEHQPLYKVTITPRGPSLGHTSFEPKIGEYSASLDSLESTIAAQLGGRIAEELIFGEKSVTTGAESDLQSATKLAYHMVTKWGYSKALGPIYHNESLDFISKNVIEQEIKSIIQYCQNLAKDLLVNNKNKLHKIAQRLLEKETLDAKEVQKIIDSCS